MFGGEKLRKLIDGTNYTIKQFNGQRIYGLRSNMANIFPPKGCELFVGRLPRDLYEDELVPLFSTIATIFELRLMLDFQGNNRGYCFVRYFTREAAETAIRKLNQFQVRAGCRLGVYWSVDNTRLFIGGLPRDKTKEEILQKLENYIDDIKSIIMYQSHDNVAQNRGYAFMEFENHRAAAIARRRFPPGSVMWGSLIRVDWADPIPEPDPQIMSQVATLYMRNLPISLSNEAFINELYKTINVYILSKVHKSLDYAFVHFINRTAAEEALILLQNFKIANKNVEVSWARPQTFSRKYTSNTTPDHYCMSLPAKSRWLIKRKSMKRHSPISQSSNCDNLSSESSQSDSPVYYFSHDTHKIANFLNL